MAERDCVILQSPKIAVFAYNFPHKKTQDFLLRLFAEGYRIAGVLASDPVALNIPPSTVRTKIRHIALQDPRAVAEAIGSPYHVVPHRGPEVREFLLSEQFDLAVIAGARILKKPVIETFRHGIINFHPGLIPESRGLDAMLWSIHRDIPLGVTAHLIDEHVDAGKLLIKSPIRIFEDDTALDLSERLYELQLEMLRPAVEAALKGEGTPIDPDTPYNRKMPGDLEEAAVAKIPAYVQQFAGQENRNLQ